ncbi:MAG TPA: hypothetical protein VN618_08155 [Solirubrobacteraceae bacterium]|nr:hypothetical protein [Solirubrobacteraceae bacterium]
MKAGAFARKAAEKEPFTKLRSSGRIVSNPMWEVHDREVRRGIALAKALDLTGPGEEVERDRFAALDGDDKPVSLDERRRRKSSAQKRGA